MAMKEQTLQNRTHNVTVKTIEKRKSETVRRFVDKHVNASTEITPDWQRAIDNYTRVKDMKITR